MEATAPAEGERLRELASYGVLDTPPERAFDDLTFLAARACGTPYAFVSLVDDKRQWFKSAFGSVATETPRSESACAHAILDPRRVLVVPDMTQDVRFRDFPSVAGPPGYRFYAGAPLVTPDGHALGTLCVLDTKPRALSDDEERALVALARRVVVELELRRTIRLLEEAIEAESGPAEAEARPPTPGWGAPGGAASLARELKRQQRHARAHAAFGARTPEGKLAEIVRRLRWIEALEESAD